MGLNFPLIFGVAFIPMLIGGLWYSPLLFNNAWMKAADMTEEKANSGNMVLIMGLSYLFSVMIAMFLTNNVIHQQNVLSLFAGDPAMNQEGSEIYIFLENFKAKYGHLHRSFTHGMIHGGFMGVFLVLPIITIKSLFERKGFKYIAINAGYWFVTLMLMGGLLCQFT